MKADEYWRAVLFISAASAQKRIMIKSVFVVCLTLPALQFHNLNMLLCKYKVCFCCLCSSLAYIICAELIIHVVFEIDECRGVKLCSRIAEKANSVSQQQLAFRNPSACSI